MDEMHKLNNKPQLFSRRCFGSLYLRQAPQQGFAGTTLEDHGTSDKQVHGRGGLGQVKFSLKCIIPRVQQHKRNTTDLGNCLK